MHTWSRVPTPLAYETASRQTLRILIADSSQFICDAMRQVLARQQDVFIVGCACNEEELAFLLPHCNILLLSTSLDSRGASSILADILQAHPKVKVLIVGAHDEAERLLHYFEAGAIGCVLKGESVDSLLDKMRAAREGKALVSPELAAHLARRLAVVASEPAIFRAARSKLVHFDKLTNREREVLHFVSMGLTNQEIADRLLISYGTVKNHVHHTMKKLEAHSRREAGMLYKLQQSGAACMARK